MTISKKIGILGGGQLGRMLCEAGSPWDLQIHVLDQSENYPASRIASHFVAGDFTDYDDVLSFGQKMDVVTIEIEGVNLEALVELEFEGVQVAPSSEVVRTIRDKGMQKQFYKARSFPTSAFKLYGSKKEIWQAILVGELDYPFVQKARRDGYDGRGVVLIRTEEDLPSLMNVPSVIEDLVPIKKELAMTIGRNWCGGISVFPLVEMEFDPVANLVTHLVCPADVDISLTTKAVDIVTRLADEMKLVGLLAVEFFLDQSENLMINEAAPRTHNSGHHTIEACNYSQFDIQLRALLNLPMPQITLLKPAGMMNLLGEKDHQGKPQIAGLDALMSLEDCYLHWYGKPETRPNRKMGHITVLADNVKTIIEKLAYLSEQIKVTT